MNKTPRTTTSADPIAQLEQCFWENLKPLERRRKSFSYDAATKAKLWRTPEERYKLWAHIHRWILVETQMPDRPLNESVALIELSGLVLQELIEARAEFDLGDKGFYAWPYRNGDDH